MFEQTVLIFFVSFLSVSNAITWSNWTSCSKWPDDYCHTKIMLKCDKGEGIQCVSSRIHNKYQIKISKDCDQIKVAADCDVHNDTLWENRNVSIVFKLINCFLFNN